MNPTPAPRPSRRAFLRYAGAASAAAALVLAGCKTDDPAPTNSGSSSDPNAPATTLGSGDVAYLNLLQVEKQVSTALYQRILDGATGPADLSAADRLLLTAILDQALLHREALRVFANTLRGPKTTTDLSPTALALNTAAFDTGSRATALAAALTLQNLIVSTAVGLARYVSKAGLNTVVHKMMSVDARHAATLADLLPGTNPFAPSPGYVGFNALRRPSEVIPLLNLYLSGPSRLVVGNLP